MIKLPITYGMNLLMVVPYLLSPIKRFEAVHNVSILDDEKYLDSLFSGAGADLSWEAISDETFIRKT